VLSVPFTEASGEFGWGAWAEVEPVVHRQADTHPAAPALDPYLVSEGGK